MQEFDSLMAPHIGIYSTPLCESLVKVRNTWYYGLFSFTKNGGIKWMYQKFTYRDNEYQAVYIFFFLELFQGEEDRIIYTDILFSKKIVLFTRMEI